MPKHVLTAQCGGQRRNPFPWRVDPDGEARLERYARYDDAFKTRVGAARRRARRSVEESGTCGVGTKTQAGGRFSIRIAASRKGRRACRSAIAAGAERAARASPGRLKTAIGTVAAIDCHARQR